MSERNERFTAGAGEARGGGFFGLLTERSSVASSKSVGFARELF